MTTQRLQAKNLNPERYSQQLLDNLKQLQALWSNLQASWREDKLAQMRQLLVPLSQLASPLKLLKKANDLETYAQILDLNLAQFQQQGQSPNYAERHNIQEQLDDLSLSAEQFSTYIRNPFHDIAGHAHKTICIVSADEILQKNLSQLLKQVGYYVQVLTSIPALLQATHLFTPLALIVDMRLKQGDINVTRVMYTIQKSRRQSLSVFFISHKNTLKARLAAVRAGCAGFFMQPLDHHSLLAGLEKLHFHSRQQHYKVLLVDDKGDYYQKYVRELDSAPLSLQYSDNCFNLPDLDPIDLLIVRMELSNMTGLELVKVIRQQRRYLHLPIVVLTSELEQNLSQTAIQGVADDVVRDQITPKRLGCLVINRIEHSKKRQQIFKEYAEKDKFTGMYNKDYLLEYIKDYQASRYGEHPLSIWFIDLSQNYYDEDLDPLQTENQIRLDAANLIHQTSHKHEQIAVWDNQRLVLLTEHYASLDLGTAAKSLAKRLQNQLQNNERGYGLKRCAIGIAVHQNQQGKAWKTLWRAKQACDELIKNADDERQILLDDSHVSAQYQEILAPKRQEFVTKQLQQALAHHQQQQSPHLALCYQPIANVHGKQISFYDSLLRLYHQDGDSISPSEFLQVANKEGLSAKLDHWVTRQALNDLVAKYQQQQAVRFFVKLDDCSIEDPSFIDWLQERLQSLDIPHDALIFDLNSSHLVGNPYIHSFVVGIKSLGCGLSLRNFLYEQNHLALLEQLSLDFIKLHPGITDNLELDNEAFIQIKHIVDKAHGRGCEVVAIRLEHADKLSLLWQAQIDYVEGHFVQAPDKHLNFNFAA